jgi:hypothetical protein
MVVDPLEPLGMHAELLDRTPIDTYFWPGVFLLAIASASALTLPGLLFGWQWSWAAGIERWVGYRWPWIGAVSIGSILLVFEMLEVYLFPFHPIMHPLLITISVLLLGLSFAPSTKAHLCAGTAS